MLGSSINNAGEHIHDASTVLANALGNSTDKAGNIVAQAVNQITNSVDDNRSKFVEGIGNVVGSAVTSYGWVQMIPLVGNIILRIIQGYM